MKINLDIDCTPQELRAFFGLPDVEPLQKMAMEQMQQKLESGFTADDMEKMMTFWLTGTNAGLEQFQKFFMGNLSNK